MCFPVAHGRTGSRAAMLQVKRHDTVLAPHRLKTQGIDDALIQPYSGHAIRQSLETHSRLALPTSSSATTISSATSPSDSTITLVCPW
jgi:hypothetical protein